MTAHIRVDGGKEYAPSLRQFPNNAQAIGTPSVRTTLVDDVYLSLLTAPADGDVVNVRVIIEPLAVWMWIGGGAHGVRRRAGGMAGEAAQSARTGVGACAPGA